MKTKDRELAHATVQSIPEEKLRKLVVVGKSSICGAGRIVVSVTLSYHASGFTFQGTGVAVTSPTDKFDRKKGEQIAYGRAELALGAEIMSFVFPNEASYKDLATMRNIAVLVMKGDKVWLKRLSTKKGATKPQYKIQPTPSTPKRLSAPAAKRAWPSSS